MILLSSHIHKKLVVQGFTHQPLYAKLCHHQFLFSTFSCGGNGGGVGKYTKFRNKALSILQSGKDCVNDVSTLTHSELAQQAVSLLAQKSNTWKRLSDIIELSSSSRALSSRSSQKTIVDIGCDHGLLAIALAVSGRYEKVIGIDVSKNALQGAFEFHDKVMDILLHKQERREEEEEHCQIHGDDASFKARNPTLPLEYRHGNGLEPLYPGEADAICIAGMGVDTMLSILCNEVDDTETNQSVNHLDYLENQILYLQPPKNRPKHLILLYKTMCENGWFVQDERIVSVKNRWYITSAFVKETEEVTTSDEFILPGHFLSTSSTHQSEFSEYVQHQLKWLDDDFQSKGSITSDEMKWKETFGHL